jgi:hypothetical protein
LAGLVEYGIEIERTVELEQVDGIGRTKEIQTVIILNE